MGTYYHYVNHTKREYVTLSGLRKYGDKEGAALACGGALVWLLMPWPFAGDRYRGRWNGDLVEVMADQQDESSLAFALVCSCPPILSSRISKYEHNEGCQVRWHPDLLLGERIAGEHAYLDITPGLLDDLIARYPELFKEWEPHRAYRPYRGER